VTMSNQNSYSLPTSSLHAPTTTAPKKAWRERLNFKSLNHSTPTANSGSDPSSNHDESNLETPAALGQTSTRSSKPEQWWKVRLFRGMINDVRRRAPFFVSDWVDAWDYRVVPATVYMYFAK